MPEPERPASGVPRRALSIALVVLALVGAAGVARAGSVTKEVAGVLVTVDSPWPPGLLQGWMPLGVTLENTTDRVATIAMSSRQSNTGDSRASGQQRLAPGETRTLRWLLPVFLGADTQIDLSLLVDDRWERLDVSADPSTTNYDDAYTLLALARDEAIPARALAPPGSTSHTSLPTVVRHDELPGDWRAYTSLARLLVSAEDGLPDEAVRTAILDWVAAGGTLQVIGDGAGWDLPLDERFAASGHDLIDDGDLISQHRHGFGWIQRTHHPRSDLTPGYGLTRTQALPPNRRLGVLSQGVGTVVSLPGMGEIPTRLLTLVLVIFFVCMGPLQFWWLKRRGKPPVSLLLTTPVMGFGFALLLLGASLFQQGFSVHQALTSMTWLDQTRHHATSVAQRTVYSGSVFDSSLHYDAASAATGLVFGLVRQMGYEVDLDSGALTGSYLPVRAPTAELLARSATARQRLAIEREGDELFALNGLGVEVLDLWYHDEHGEAWRPDRADVLEPGARVRLVSDTPPEGAILFSTTLTPATRLAALPRDRDQTLPSAWPAFNDGTAQVPPRCYVALLASSPFLDDGGVRRETINERCVLFGDLGPVP